ncbi:ribonuclease Z [Fulvivirga lutea]|uniref:Ribonuclease Z n=1 Tax=Fulvivirga lutea TaxID=2810512 RepID=A0A975A0A3_9BACT|nr:ribonuclease Z [Fulvivirga lutea]QSE96252.1 ribonuclease Z [Fulvivirga lutea]
MPFELKILGCNSATPAYGRHHTSQLLHTGKNYFLIDCGEGTQERLTQYKAHTGKINHIFISHLHGDHYLGLMGLLFTMHLLKRSHDIHLYGQRGLDEIILTQLRYSDSKLNYKIVFHELDPKIKENIFEDDQVEVYSFPLKHRIPCCGFLFKEKPKPYRINKEKLTDDISLQAIASLKQGKDFIDERTKKSYKVEEYTLPPRKSRSYAYCSDTKYDEDIIPIIKDADLLYHEATFLADKAKWAHLTFHSTTHEAGKIAKAANVGQLLIGHYSARYKDVTPFVEEAREIFANTILSEEGQLIEVED